MKAYDVIDSPEKWIQGSFARTKTGGRANVQDEKAYCFCVVGAIYRAYEEDKAIKQLSKLQPIMGNALMGWNDEPGRTWEEVYQLLKDNDI